MGHQDITRNDSSKINLPNIKELVCVPTLCYFSYIIRVALLNNV